MSQVLFPGQNNNGVLLLIDGKPALTAKEFDKYVEVAEVSQKDREQYNKIKKAIYKIITRNRILKAWIKKKGFDKDPLYKVPDLPPVANENERLKQELEYLRDFWIPEEGILLKYHPLLQPQDQEIKDWIKKREDELITRFYASFNAYR